MKRHLAVLLAVLCCLTALCGCKQQSTGSDAAVYTCTFSIDCTTALNDRQKLAEEKQAVLPTDGVILPASTVSFSEGETVYEVLQRVCRENGIPMEASLSPLAGSAYVEGIGNLYEFDCGDGSGWIYQVNGSTPNEGCGRYVLSQDDRVAWRYTCDFGNDLSDA